MKVFVSKVEKKRIIEFTKGSPKSPGSEKILAKKSYSMNQITLGETLEKKVD